MGHGTVLRRLLVGVAALSATSTVVLAGPVASGAPLSVAAAKAAAAARPPGPQRAMWLWNWTDNAAVVAFAQTHHVREIFAYTAPGFTDPATVPPLWSQPEWPLISDLAARTGAAHIRLDALGGDPSWVPNPSVAARWAAEVAASGLFAGVHLDLEPWQLPAWSTARAATIAQTVAAVVAVRAALPTIPLELSLPWWLYQHHTADGTPLDLALLAHADTACIISFFNDAAQVESFAAHEQADAARLSKPSRLAVETNAVQPSWITFAGTPQAAFDQVLRQIDAANAATPGYVGVAVEDFNGWAALPA